MYSKISNILNDINTVLVPRLCFGCNALLYRGEEHVCTVCRNQLPLTEYTFNAVNPVDRIFYGRINIIKASSFLFFTEKGIVKSIIHYLKYKNQEQIGAFLGNWYGHILKTNNFLNNIDYVVPVPLHRKKLKKRGYNQVSLFAKHIAEHIGAQYLEGILIKTANTKTQTNKSRILRWQNKKALYVLTDYGLLKNKNVLLLDDVITTGATMEACATALSATKGINIYVASMAIVP
ncbi:MULTISPECIES: ComF family protein [unclassified Arenibacter]|uniref:ComF family protein n=1 Tax=unclassified Arenibacter TaxID=2615047 RepID=UPI000E344FE4|nr:MULTISPECIES: phosphoribosyltransferase family protein [unclassified Arenibacter]MCM4163903.1 amidophosphoribosyltransferase [Arenibacter sp. A80]RFT56610.1 ComF family protein [Arenibacter sp. P308M17]